MNLDYFDTLYQLQVFYPALGTPWRHYRILKTNFIFNFNNFSTIRPILDFEVSLERAYQDLKLCIRG